MAGAPVDGVMTRDRMISLVSLPPILAFTGWLAMLAIAAVTGRHPIWSLEPRNLPEAVAFRDAGESVRRIERGEDPNRAAEVRARVVLDDTASLTPIEAAAATRQGEMVQLLLDLGASPDATVWQRAWCISNASAVREVLAAHRPPGAMEDCAVQ
jgi:hypothetical protein